MTKRMWLVTIGSTTAMLLLSGCATSLVELRATEPVWTGAGAANPESAAQCTQDVLQDEHGGLWWGKLAGIYYEQRAGVLIGRHAMAPSDTLFEARITPEGTALRMPSSRWGQEAAVVDALERCTDGQDAKGRSR